MFLSILFSSLVFADAPDRIHGFRTGPCLGLSTECVFTNIKVEYAGENVGFSLGIPLLDTLDKGASASVHWYPAPVRENKNVSWRRYVYGSGAVIFSESPFVGGGAGADIHFTRSRRLCLQPSLGVTKGLGWPFNELFLLPSGSLGMMYTF